MGVNQPNVLRVQPEQMLVTAGPQSPLRIAIVELDLIPGRHAGSFIGFRQQSYFVSSAKSPAPK
jgi:hypothetical protein